MVGCGRWRAFGFDSTHAEIEVGADGAKLHGHFKCGNVWTCDQCARARVSQARSWIRAALIPALEAHGLGAAMMTFTMAHSYDGNWKDSVDLLHAAFKLFDKNMSRRYKAIGCMGKLKSFEAPVGVHGIHGHFHVLLTYLLGVDLTAFEALARAEWEKAVAQVGGKCNDHGFDLKLNAMADYLAKQELAHEMSNHDTKKARKRGCCWGSCWTGPAEAMPRHPPNGCALSKRYKAVAAFTRATLPKNWAFRLAQLGRMRSGRRRGKPLR